MRILLQRVSQAQVEVEGRVVGHTGPGLLVFAAVAPGDTPAVFQTMAAKVVNLRIFPSGGGEREFDRSLLEAGGSILLVSQFTLYADCRRGRRPGFSNAAPPAQARELFDQFAQVLRDTGVPVETGEFGAMMQVGLVNDGPVTIWLDSGELAAPRSR